MASAPKIGGGVCPGCGAKVAVQVGKNGKAFMWCRGYEDEKACDTKVYFGDRPSRNMIKAAGEGETKTIEKADEKKESGNDELPAKQPDGNQQDGANERTGFNLFGLSFE